MPLLLIAAFLLGALPTPPAVYEAATCAFAVPPGVEVECGYLSVPEDRSNPNSPTIRLHVGVFKSQSATPQADPIVYLEGGPGGSALMQMENAFVGFFQPFTATRDLVVFDQRGTGYSQPNLACPEATEAAFAALAQDPSPQEEVAQQLAALRACQERLSAQGINLSAYNSRENAADLDALRAALGYEQWNLFGISYGTRLALTALRDFPQGIRSVVLDSSYPLEQDLYAAIAPNFDRALRQLFEGCTAECARAYPDLENVFYQTVQRLAQTPVLVESSLPSNLNAVEVLVTDTLLMEFMFQALYQSQLLPYLPQIIYAASQDDFGLLTLLYLAILEAGDQVSYGMNVSVQCNEEIPFSDPTADQSTAFPQFQDFLARQLNLGKGMYEVCALWWGGQQATPAPQENQAVSSSVPALVLAGQYDPITPPAWGRQVAAALPNSQFFEFPGVGHGVSVAGECPAALMLAFWDTPAQTLEASCLDALAQPAFLTPTAAYTLVPFRSDELGVSGVRPEGWDEVMPGVYGRPPLADAALMQFTLPMMDIDNTLQLMAAQFGLPEAPPSLGSHAANGRKWRLYTLELRGLVVYLAAAEGEQASYLVALQTTPAEADALYGAVFLPALDAFVPLTD